MRDELHIEKNLKGSGRGLTKIISRLLPGETKENYENGQSG
jgi:hypothetical protein